MLFVAQMMSWVNTLALQILLPMTIAGCVICKAVSPHVLHMSHHKQCAVVPLKITPRVCWGESHVQPSSSCMQQNGVLLHSSAEDCQAQLHSGVLPLFVLAAGQCHLHAQAPLQCCMMCIISSYHSIFAWESYHDAIADDVM